MKGLTFRKCLSYAVIGISVILTGILVIPLGILLVLIFILWTAADKTLRLLEEKNKL